MIKFLFSAKANKFVAKCIKSKDTFLQLNFVIIRQIRKKPFIIYIYLLIHLYVYVLMLIDF